MAIIDTFQDQFLENTINPTWTTSNSGDPTQVLMQNNRLEITHSANAQYNSLQSVSTYDLTGSSVSVQIINRGDQSISSHEVILGAYLDSSNIVWLTFNVNTLSAYKRVAGVQVQVGSSAALNPTLMRFIRMRESAGTIFYEYSSSGAVGDWTQLTSVANPFAVTALVFYCQSGCYNVESVGSFGWFNNFNFTRGSAPVTRPYVRVGSGMSRSDM